MLEPDEGDVVGDVDQAQFADHVLDGFRDDRLARRCMRLSVHWTLRLALLA